MSISGIYQIQSRIKPERIYIGSAVNIQRRWKEHLYKLKIQRHDNRKLQNHFNKYGKNDLIFSILIGCAKDDLLTTEQFYLDSKKCWFNINQESNSSLGIKHTKEAIEKNRKAHLGLTHTDEYKKQESEDRKGEKNPFFGKHHSIESNQKRREWNILHPPTKEAREKQRQSLLKHFEQKRLKIETINLN